MSNGITVILSTYNRAAVLAETLEAFCKLDIDAMDVEFVVVDNNSSDETASVINSFKTKLPLVGLSHAIPGKNGALNHALDTVELGELVVFTDDDVTPEGNWLRSITESSKEMPDWDVFGGRVVLQLPKDAPGWARNAGLARWAFAEHDLGRVPVTYPADRFPCGPNFWIRGRVFGRGFRYDESVGPTPGRRIMGSETSFLLMLRKEGLHPIFWPQATLQHRIQESLLSVDGILRKATWNGRWMARLQLEGEATPRVLSVWSFKRCAGLVRHCFEGQLARLSFSFNHQVLKRIEAARGVAFSSESLLVARDRRRAQHTSSSRQSNPR